MAVTTRANVTGIGTFLQNYLNKKVIENLEPETRFYGMGMQASRQAWYNTLSWTRMRNFKVTTAAATLVEAVTPTEQQIIFDTVTTQATQYGLLAIISDLLMDTEPVESRGRAASELGANMARIYDNVVQDVLSTNGINVIYAGAATSRATIVATDLIIMNDLAKANAFLSTQGAKEYSQGYVAVMHPNQIYDIFVDTTAGKNFIEVVKYTNAVDRIFRGEVGMIHNIRVIKSSNIQTFTNILGTVVYPTYVMGRDVYGVAPLQTLKTYYSKTSENGTVDKSDPLNQRNTVGTKGAFACLILQQKGLLRIEAASRLNYARDFNTDGTTTNF